MKPSESKIEIVATVLLALATLVAAWAGYQSTRWHSKQAEAQMSATASRIEATRIAGVANREAQIDVGLFVQWVNARSAGDNSLATFYRNRFTERFEPAFEEWLKARPFTNPKAPKSPFEMPAYRPDSLTEVDRLEKKAATMGALAVKDIERADRYLLAVVLLAACLFLAGISTRLSGRSAQLAILSLGWIIFLATSVWLLTFPVTVVV